MENETSPGEGWWQASDANWYPPETHPDYLPPVAQSQAAAAPVAPTAPLVPSAAPPAAPLPAPIYEPVVADMALGPQFEPVAPSGPSAPTPSATAPVPPAPSAQPNHAQPNSAQPNTAPGGTRPWWKQPWVAVLAVALCVAATVVAVGSNNSSPDQATTGADSSAAEPTARPAVPPATNGEPTDLSHGDGAPGDRGNPFGFDTPVPVTVQAFGDADGSIWNVTVQMPRDMTAEVLATNDFNDPPPDGVTFVGFDVEMTLASASEEPLSSLFSLDWGLAGGESNAVYDEGTLEDLFGCGLILRELNIFAEVFVGGTIAGTVCIPIPVDDAEHPNTQPVLLLSNSLVAFGPGGLTPLPAAIDAPRPSASDTEHAYDTIAPVISDSFSGEESVWNVKLGPPRDITAQVVSASDFNDPPPDGILYVGFDAEVTLAKAAVEPVAVGLNHNWEIFGGATSGVYDSTTIGGLFGCGSFDGDFDDFDEVFAGGTAQGIVCLPLPAEDLDDPATKIAMNFNGDRVVFSAQGQLRPPAGVEIGPGPAGLANTQALSDPVELQWDVFGDADGSVWATAVGPWRDITDQVLAENDFNDPPPAGVVYAGFEVELTLVDARAEPLSPSFNISWEILGGETLRIYQSSTLVENFGCGVVPGELDVFAEIFPGGTVQGTVCVPIPLQDLDHPDTRIALVIGDQRIPFGPR